MAVSARLAPYGELLGCYVQIGDVVVVAGTTRHVDAFEARRTGSGARVALEGRWQFALYDGVTYRVYRDRA